MTRTALVTGAASGIGRAIALQLAKDGYNVAITDLSHQSELGSQVIKEIESLGSKGHFIVADASKRSEMFQAVEETSSKFNGFNTMINNAGIMTAEPLLSLDEKRIQKTMDINFNGVIWGIQAAAKEFEKLGHGGKIINACSFLGFNAFPFLGIYCASKFAVRGITQVAAKELASKKITVNAYCPGMVNTSMLANAGNDLSKELGLTPEQIVSTYTKSHITLGEIAQPEDIANLVSFLGDEKSNYITGQSIHVDGGIVF
ncbi:hypothetical protein WICMUC_000379 [Wickerhamomyces mucosus]|uniref:Diacetyl reductase ((S)-acetoin forming) n=1 Tax=Wickerhamomyces mucosus TaxID=1378264 RepID=A0A9P8PXH3_9ASCO|nr:hypothetical protein WICMUC_000379 [Wickerhamomyces mucosus]